MKIYPFLRRPTKILFFLAKSPYIRLSFTQPIAKPLHTAHERQFLTAGARLAAEIAEQ
jgi:hypothetical protein